MQVIAHTFLDIVYRTGQILNIAFDRTPETCIYEAVVMAEKVWKDIVVANYTSTESFNVEKATGILTCS